MTTSWWPPEGQPPVFAVVHERLVLPVTSSFLMVKLLPDFDVADDGVALGVRRGDRNRAGARRGDVQAGVAEVGRGLALRVVLLVRVARLDLRDGVTSVRLGVGVLALLLLAQEGRQSDGGEDADDQDDDEELDEREALLRSLRTLCSTWILLGSI